MQWRLMGHLTFSILDLPIGQKSWLLYLCEILFTSKLLAPSFFNALNFIPNKLISHTLCVSAKHTRCKTEIPEGDSVSTNFRLCDANCCSSLRKKCTEWNLMMSLAPHVFVFPAFSPPRKSQHVPKTRWNLRWKLNTTLARVPRGSERGRRRKLIQFSLAGRCSQNSHLLYKLRAAKSSCPNQIAWPSRH